MRLAITLDFPFKQLCVSSKKENDRFELTSDSFLLANPLLSGDLLDLSFLLIFQNEVFLCLVSLMDSEFINIIKIIVNLPLSNFDRQANLK